MPQVPLYLRPECRCSVIAAPADRVISQICILQKVGSRTFSICPRIARPVQCIAHLQDLWRRGFRGMPPAHSPDCEPAQARQTGELEKLVLAGPT